MIVGLYAGEGRDFCVYFSVFHYQRCRATARYATRPEKWEEGWKKMFMWWVGVHFFLHLSGREDEINLEADNEVVCSMDWFLILCLCL